MRKRTTSRLVYNMLVDLVILDLFDWLDWFESLFFPLDGDKSEVRYTSNKIRYDVITKNETIGRLQS